MPESNYEFEQFFNREGFNNSLAHFKTVSGLLGDFESRYNLADILNSLLAEDEIKQNQLSPILYALLVDKYGYRSISHNMKQTIEDFEEFTKEAKKWKALDIVIAYHHPELGFSVINPKNPDHWESVQGIKRNELVIVYAGGFADSVDKRTADAALKTVIAYLEGKNPKTPESLLKGKYTYKAYYLDEEEEEEEKSSAPQRRRAPARASFGDSSSSGEGDDSGESEAAPTRETAPPPPPKPAENESAGGARRMTPMYSVPVTNELFHNGNVEAWKKIIQSYQMKYPGCEVSVFYEGEKIHDINTLFKWGKVKHGSTILFAILGTDIKDVAKLQRYLRQGASPQFEAFLRFPVNTVLKLF